MSQSLDTTGTYFEGMADFEPTPEDKSALEVAMSLDTNIPDLEPHCGSWIVVSRETGKAVFETYSRKTAEKINQEKYEVLTAYQWLIRFNQTVKREQIEESPAASLGRRGGQSTTPAKTQASRSNGKKGGRPSRINSDAFD